MKDGPYLLVLLGDDYGRPVTLNNQRNPDGSAFQIIVGVDGIKIVSNLAPGYQLIPLVIMTPERIKALEVLLDPDFVGVAEQATAHKVILAMLAEGQP
jgi:hypothetical protein